MPGNLDETSTARCAVLALMALASSGSHGRGRSRSILRRVAKGPMEVTVDDEGKTRVRHIYTVSAPIAGKVLRISHPVGEQGISLHVGDQVDSGRDRRRGHAADGRRASSTCARTRSCRRRWRRPMRP